MKRVFLALITIASLTMYSCMCGCGIEDPETPYEELSETGQLLRGKHYLDKIPGTNSYFTTLEEGEIRMFATINGKSVILNFWPSEVVFVETDEEPHLKFSWTAGNLDKNLHMTIHYRVEEVSICISKELRYSMPVESGSTEKTTYSEDEDYVQSLIEGTNTFEE